jgi:putative DNA primase/helicase
MKTRVLKPWLKLDAIAEDEATKEFFAIIEFRDRYGGMRRATIPLTELDDRNALAKTLTNLGMYFSNMDTKSKRAVLDKLLDSNRKTKRISFAARVGWYRGGYHKYVLANGVIGTADSEVAIRPPRLKSPGHAAAIGRRGEHAEWLRTVAAHAKFSSRMLFAISAALAAPLLKMAKLHSFGILVHGPGKAGKSTMLVAAASVTGYGREQDLPNFRATDAAFGEIPAAFNDSLLPLNELSLLKGSATEKYQRLRDFTYGFAEGRGTTYSKLAPIHGVGAALEWLSILLATGEEPANEIARDAHAIRMVGESVRWIDLIATRNGVADIFDRIPENVPEERRAKWAENRCITIRDGCEQNHGVAIRHFIRRIIQHRRTIQQDLVSLRETFVDHVIDKNDGPAVRHLAKCFGHIYAAAIIGVRFGTLPWSKELVRKCIARCYGDARRELNTEADLLRDGLGILHARIRALPKANGAASKSTEGFRTGGMRYRATIRAEAFKGWFPDARQPNLVLKSLRSKNALPSRPMPPTKNGPAIVWAESQPTWPDGSRPRSVVIDVQPDLFKGLKA